MAGWLYPYPRFPKQKACLVRRVLSARRVLVSLSPWGMSLGWSWAAKHGWNGALPRIKHHNCLPPTLIMPSSVSLIHMFPNAHSGSGTRTISHLATLRRRVETSRRFRLWSFH